MLGGRAVDGVDDSAVVAEENGRHGSLPAAGIFDTWSPSYCLVFVNPATSSACPFPKSPPFSAVDYTGTLSERNAVPPGAIRISDTAALRNCGNTRRYSASGIPSNRHSTSRSRVLWATISTR